MLPIPPPCRGAGCAADLLRAEEVRMERAKYLCTFCDWTTNASGGLHKWLEHMAEHFADVDDGKSATPGYEENWP